MCELWTQVSGDMNPGAHGGVIARVDDCGIELKEIQPVLSYVGRSKAVEVGFAFWTKEAYYGFSDLTVEGNREAIRYAGLDVNEIESLSDLRMAIAVAKLNCGDGAEEGPCGWSKDILGDIRVQWWGSKKPRGWRYLEDDDKEFRAVVREEKKKYP